VNDAPKLLVEWSSPWQEFVTAIRPAMGRSGERLAGEARSGLFPYRGMMVSWALEAALLIAVIVVPARLAKMRPYLPPSLPKYDIIYFSGEELPRAEDAGGAQSGRSGRAGGQEAHHRTQTIRVARGSSLREKVVDAPRLNLPRSDSAVANLLAFKTIPGPAPAEGLKSSNRLPAMSAAAVAPAPQIDRDKIQGAPTLEAAVIPPAPAAQRDLASLRLPGSHSAEVIPPPVSAPEQISNSNPQLTLPAPTIDAPPPQITHEIASGPGFGAGELRKQVVPPPVQMGEASAEHRNFGGLESAAVIPPPVQVGGASLQHQSVGGLGGGTSVVPPPPSVSASTSVGGQGSGNRGLGRGGPLDLGTAIAAPPASGGSNAGTGVVVSNQPGSKVGMPGSGGAGSLAMSPSGGDKAGLGGSGGGSSIGRGNGSGSGFSGEGSGAAKAGTGRGSDVSAHGGISPYPGTGGAGSGTNGKPVVPGVSVRGGSNIVTLPSFGTDGNQSAGGGRSSSPDRHGSGITVVATSRSGGAFNFYGALKGDKVYTIYIETGLGTAVMQFADPTSAAHAYSGDLTAPEPMRADVPSDLQRSRLVIACILDRSGLLRNAQVLEPGGSEMTGKVLASLPNWKFRPVLRGDQPVEVNAILGFNIDTR
jgi:hypothetical protein